MWKPRSQIPIRFLGYSSALSASVTFRAFASSALPSSSKQGGDSSHGKPQRAAPQAKASLGSNDGGRFYGSPHPNYEVWVGLETHAQISSNTKLFSGASTSFLAPPNSRAAFFDAAIPGTLPRINSKCVEQTIRTGLALGGKIANECRFDRKHYFYCDMPLGFQVTQQEFPLVVGGQVSLDDLMALDSDQSGSESKKKPKSAAKDSQEDTKNEANAKTSGDDVSSGKVVRISRVQLEQDSGKNIHDARPGFSYVDLNRAGCALMEIVTEPDIRSAEEATAYVRKLQALLRQIGASTGNMEDGSLRCDVNVTVRRISPPGKMTQRVEIKNLNSLRGIFRSIEFEAKRQIELLESGGHVERETRSFNAKSGETSRLRSKEELLDYRFLPEPDLPVLKVKPNWVDQISESMPELPDVLFQRFTKDFGLSKAEATFLVYEPGASNYFLDLTGFSYTSTPTRSPKICASWFCSELFGRINKLRVMQQQQLQQKESQNGHSTVDAIEVGLSAAAMNWGNVGSERLGELIDMITESSISGKQGKEILDSMVLDQDIRSPKEIATERNMVLDSDPDRIRNLCKSIVDLYPDEVDEFVSKGRQQFFGFLVGQTIKLSKQEQQTQASVPGARRLGEANPKQVATQMRLELTERGLLKQDE